MITFSFKNNNNPFYIKSYPNFMNNDYFFYIINNNNLIFQLIYPNMMVLLVFIYILKNIIIINIIVFLYLKLFVFKYILKILWFFENNIIIDFINNQLFHFNLLLNINSNSFTIKLYKINKIQYSFKIILFINIVSLTCLLISVYEYFILVININY